MKTMRTLVFAGAILAAASIQAQINFVFVGKDFANDQTDATTVTPTANPYSFGVSIDGTGLSGSNPAPPNTVTVPSGSVSSVTLIFTDQWGFKSAGYANITALDADFGGGDYGVNLTGSLFTEVALSTGDLFPNAPKATITTDTTLGFSWGSGVLNVNPALFNTLTVTTNAFATNFSASSNHIGIHGENFTSGLDGESFDDVDGVFLLNISAASFLTGSTTKYIEMEFNNLLDFFEDTPSLGITSVSAYSAVTKFEINVQAIPEPSTYVAILGALALAGVILHRRRRLA